MNTLLLLLSLTASAEAMFLNNILGKVVHELDKGVHAVEHEAVKGFHAVKHETDKINYEQIPHAVANFLGDAELADLRFGILGAMAAKHARMATEKAQAELPPAANTIVHALRNFQPHYQLGTPLANTQRGAARYPASDRTPEGLEVETKGFTSVPEAQRVGKRISIEREFLGQKYRHYGVYIGGGQVLHFFKPSYSPAEKATVTVTAMDMFLWSTAEKPRSEDELMIEEHFVPKIGGAQLGGGATELESADRQGLHLVFSDDGKLLQPEVEAGEYHPIKNNCEHFVNRVLTGKSYSPQAEEVQKNPVISQILSGFFEM